MNKKGNPPTVLLVVMTFILVAAAWFSFYNNSNEVKTELSDVYFVNKVYYNEFSLEKEINKILEDQVLINYASAINQNEKDAASKFIIDKYNEKIDALGFKYYNLIYKEDKFYFSGELDQPVTGCLDKNNVWKWGDFNNKEDCSIGIIYRPNINFNLDLNVIGLIDFKNYFDKINKCKSQIDIEKCLKTEINGFEITYDQKDKKATFKSNQFYFISGKLSKIEFEEEFT